MIDDVSPSVCSPARGICSITVPFGSVGVGRRDHVDLEAGVPSVARLVLVHARPRRALLGPVGEEDVTRCPRRPTSRRPGRSRRLVPWARRTPLSSVDRQAWRPRASPGLVLVLADHDGTVDLGLAGRDHDVDLAARVDVWSRSGSWLDHLVRRRRSLVGLVSRRPTLEAASPIAARRLGPRSSRSTQAPASCSGGSSNSLGQHEGRAGDQQRRSAGPAGSAARVRLGRRPRRRSTVRRCWSWWPSTRSAGGTAAVVRDRRQRRPGPGWPAR